MTTAPSQSDLDPKPGTRERLLDVAERLFAERGFSGTSVREITDAAGTNLAAINYHFHSKENLYAEVFQRRIAEVHGPFLGSLRDDRDLMEGDLEAALAAFGKAFTAPHEDPVFSRRILNLCSREMIEAQLPSGLFLREFVTPLIEMIVIPIRRARPDLDENATCDCAHSFLAQLLHIVKGAHAAAGTDIVIAPVSERLAHVVRFTAAAVRHI
jgi:TetR/AcrR family transcriptional regulator, regulator of cefoperazone and chloramphenicol sensitivity